MLCGVKLRTADPTIINNIISAGILEFNKKEITKNGAVIETYYWRGLYFIIAGGLLEIRGSIHTFFNQGKNNHCEFSFENLLFAVNEFEQSLNVERSAFTIHNVEVGFNVELDARSDIYLKRIVAFLGAKVALARPINISDPKSCNAGIRFDFEQYEFKIYSKDFSPKGNILRLELRVTTMQKLKRVGIKTLADLVSPKVLIDLYNEFERNFGYVLLAEDLALAGLSNKNLKVYKECLSKEMWPPLSPKKRLARKKIYLQLLNDFAISDYKGKLWKLLNIAWAAYLLDMQNWVSNYQGKESNNGHQITGGVTFKNSIELPLDNGLKNTKSKALPIAPNNGPKVDQVRECLICKKIITHQSARSKYCTHQRKCRDTASNRIKKQNKYDALGPTFDF